LADCDWNAKEESLSMLSAQRLQQEEEFLRKFAEKVLEGP
jgi:hypothetical protein